MESSLRKTFKNPGTIQSKSAVLFSILCICPDLFVPDQSMGVLVEKGETIRVLDIFVSKIWKFWRERQESYIWDKQESYSHID